MNAKEYLQQVKMIYENRHFMISELRFSKQTNRGESLAKGKE